MALAETDLNPAYISAFAGLAGAIIGGLTSFATSWFTQQAQLRNAGRDARRAKLEALYNEYISVAAGLYVDALTHQTEDLSKMVPLYALGSRMRLVSARAVTDVALRIDDNILATYMAPNRSLQEVRDLTREGRVKTLLIAFSEACREALPAAPDHESMSAVWRRDGPRALRAGQPIPFTFARTAPPILSVNGPRSGRPPKGSRLRLSRDGGPAASGR